MSEPADVCSGCGDPLEEGMGGNCPACLWRLAGLGEEMGAEGEGVQAGARIGEYELLELIGRGGMGLVYKARQPRLNRVVALKVLLGGEFADRSFVERFRREAEMAASLHHPNIVGVYELSEDLGRWFYVMEWVSGRSLSEWCHDPMLTWRRSVEWMRTVAEAVQWAHDRGLLHRDLKPSNVLVDEEGVPRITDFGLAKRMDADSDLTQTGQVLGTPNYMAPEQAMGDPKRLGPGVDVHALGAVLYHLLCGRPPFLAATVPATLRQVMEDDPLSLRVMNPTISRDLETVCLKCLAKVPEQRYGSARELAMELGRVLRGEPVCARPLGPVSRVARWCRRKPALAGSLGVALVLMLVVVVGSPLAILSVDRARRVAESARQEEAGLRLRAEKAERETRKQLYRSLLEQARVNARSGEWGQRVRTLEAVRAGASISNSVELRREALHGLGLPDLSLQSEMQWGLDVTLIALDPAFERVAIGRGTNAVEIRAVSDSRVLGRLETGDVWAAWAAEWSRDGRFLLIRRQAGERVGSVRMEVWDLELMRRVLVLPVSRMGAAAFHPTRPWLATAEGDDGVTFWNLEGKEGRERLTFPVSGLVHHLVFSPEGDRILVHHRVGRPWFTTLFAVEDGRSIKTQVSGWVDGLAWEPGGRWLGLAARSGEVHLHEVATGETVVLGRHKHEARTAVFSPDGVWLVTGGEEQELICWDVRLKRKMFSVAQQSSKIQFCRDGRRCAVITKTGIRFHTLEKSATHRELQGDLGVSLRDVRLSPDGRWLAASSLYRTGLWHLETDAPPAIACEAEHASPFFSPDSSELYACWNGGFKRWRIQEGERAGAPPRLVARPVSELARVYSGVFSGRTLLLGTAEGVAVLEDPLRPDQFHYRSMVSHPVLEVSSNGEWLASRRGQEMWVYQVNPWRRLAAVPVGLDMATHRFDPSSSELAVCDRSGVKWIRTRDWKVARELPMALDRNAAICFTPGGESFWLARDSMQCTLYDGRTFEPLVELPAGYTAMEVSHDGGSLVVSVEKKRLEIWDWRTIRRELADLGLDWLDRGQWKP